MIDAIESLPDLLLALLLVLFTLPFGIWGMKTIGKKEDFDGKVYSFGLIFVFLAALFVLGVALYREFFQQ